MVEFCYIHTLFLQIESWHLLQILHPSYLCRPRAVKSFLKYDYYLKICGLYSDIPFLFVRSFYMSDFSICQIFPFVRSFHLSYLSKCQIIPFVRFSICPIISFVRSFTSRLTFSFVRPLHLSDLSMCLIFPFVR